MSPQTNDGPLSPHERPATPITYPNKTNRHHPADDFEGTALAYVANGPTGDVKQVSGATSGHVTGTYKGISSAAEWEAMTPEAQAEFLQERERAQREFAASLYGGATPEPVPVDHSLRRTVLDTWNSGQWPVFGEFVDRCWSDLAKGRPYPYPCGVLYAWRVVRPRVLAELKALGLVGEVRLTTGDLVPLAWHDGRVAGNVVLTVPGRVSEPVGVCETRHETAVAERFGLTRHHGQDTGLRAFCGQLTAPDEDHRLDHALTWLDRYGDPVLTAELYALEKRPEYVAELRALFGELPIVVEAMPGTRRGVRADGTLGEPGDLLVIKHSPVKPTLPSELVESDEGWKAEHDAAAEAYMERERRKHLDYLERSRPKPPPGHRPYKNPNDLVPVLRKVRKAALLDQPGVLNWAAEVIMQHVIYRELSMDTALEILHDAATLTSISPDKAQEIIDHRAEIARIRAGRVDL